MDIRIGKVTHYYNHIGVAVLELIDEIKIGDTITFLGRTTEFTQKVSSLEIEHKKVLAARPGMEVALKTDEPVRVGDAIYKASSS
jgi:hypothetical protein